MFRSCVLLLLCLAPARAARVSRHDAELAGDGGRLGKDRICGTDSIPKKLAVGASVESIRGIQWNSIFKTASAFLEGKEKDIAEIESEIADLKKQVAELMKKMKANQVPAMTAKQIKTLISDAVKLSYGEVYTAQDKLCWLGSMEPNEKADAAFGKALAPLLEEKRTDIDDVQEACLALMIKGDAYVNMCDEMCNMMGMTAAREAAKTNRVKALTSLQDRINEVQAMLSEKETIFAAFTSERDECKADEAALRAHKKSLGGLSDTIKDEKVKLFMAWNAMSTAESDLTALTADNEKLREATEELEKLLADAGDDMYKINNELQKLEHDEKALNNDLEVQTRKAKDVDAVVASTGEAIEVVSEFKFALERMVLAWNVYYSKSIVEPLQKAQSGFTVDSELKARASETAKALSDFCDLERTKTVLKSVASVPELPLICDSQIQKWKAMSANVDHVIAHTQNEQVEHLKALEQERSRVEKENAYGGSKREGIRSQVMGVWPAATYFNDTLFVKSYLRGWKTLKDDWKGDPSDIDGRWMRLCDKLYQLFQDAIKEQTKAQKLLGKTQKDFKDILAELDQIKADLAAAEKEHALSKEKADESKAKLAKMLGDEEEMKNDLLDLADKHQASLDALKAAEQAYIHDNQEAVGASRFAKLAAKAASKVFSR